MICVSGQAVAPVFTTQNIDGESTNATGTPTGTLYVTGVANAAVVTVANLETGLYSASFTVPTGQPDYTQMELVISATVDGVSAKARVWTGTILRVIQQTVNGRYDDDEATSVNVTCTVGEASKTKSVTVEDANGDPVDLTDWGDLRLVIERPNSHIDVQVVENADITISGDDNNVFTFQPNAAVLAQANDFNWSLREASTEEEIISGTIAVVYSPIKDPA